MRIVFDGYWWHKGPGANRSVQRGVINEWAAQFPNDQLIVTLREGPVEADRPPGDWVLVRSWPHAVSNSVEMPLITRSLRADAVIAHNYTPLWGPAITFIHDAMFVEHPQWFSWKENLYYSMMLPTARRAAAVCTSSATEAARISRSSQHLGPVSPIGLAIPTALSNASPSAPDQAPPPGDFALCVGRLNIRKNLASVIRGAQHSASVSPTTPLLVVGSSEYSGKGGGAQLEFADQVTSGAVRFLGHISDAELAWLYVNAALVIFLSLDEGFGLPAIEAAHFQAPLLVSDIPVFRETVGDYAHFVDPLAPAEEVAAAIDAAWRKPVNKPAAADVRERYSWATVVARLRDVVTDAVPAKTE